MTIAIAIARRAVTLTAAERRGPLTVNDAKLHCSCSETGHNGVNNLPTVITQPRNYGKSIKCFKSRLDKTGQIKMLPLTFNSELIGTGGLPVSM